MYFLWAGRPNTAVPGTVARRRLSDTELLDGVVDKEQFIGLVKCVCVCLDVCVDVCAGVCSLCPAERWRLNPKRG